MAGWKVTVNTNSVSAKLEKLEKMAEEQVKDKLEQVAWAIVSGSPVDTGAYITSHAFAETGSSKRRSRSSANKPKQQDWASKAGEAMQQLRDDIAAADLSKGQGVFRNAAPHAVDVENKHLVYAKAKDRFR